MLNIINTEVSYTDYEKEITTVVNNKESYYISQKRGLRKYYRNGEYTAFNLGFYRRN